MKPRSISTTQLANALQSAAASQRPPCSSSWSTRSGGAFVAFVAADSQSASAKARRTAVRNRVIAYNAVLEQL